MKKDIIVPRMGESISEAFIGQIFKASGSFVKQDDEILELETDKANQVINAPQSGVITLTVNPQDKVTPDQVIGTIDSEGTAEIKEEPKKESAVEEKKVEPELKKEEKAPVSNEGSARNTKDDFVQSLSAPPQPAPSISVQKPSEPKVGGTNRKKMSRIRQTIASRLVEAKTETAMLTTFNEVDMTEIMNLREKYKEIFLKKFEVKLGFMPFFVTACAKALKEYPLVNSFIEGDEVVENGSVDMGVAVSTDRGLIVPVLRQVENMSFSEIELAIENVSKKARAGTITIDEIRGGTFTITNGGTFGSLLSTPILNFPQSAILGMHKIEKRAVVIEDEIKIRSMMYLALTYDHRLIDGKEAVLFLVYVKNLLEDPGRFLLGV